MTTLLVKYNVGTLAILEQFICSFNIQKTICNKFAHSELNDKYISLK